MLLLVFLPNVGMGGSEPSPPTEDCFIGFNGPITVDDTILAFQGLITDTIGFAGLINDDPVALVGLITDTRGFEGEVCDC